jgi:hypothetical protein
MDISEDNVIIAGTLGSGIFASLDGGNSWTEVNTGISDMTIASICLSPNYINDRTAFAASTGGGVFKSIDGGRTWSSSGLMGVFINELKASPSFASDQTIFAGTWDGIYKSTDGASSWDLVSYLVRYEEDADVITTSGTWKNYKSSYFSCSQILYSDDPGSSMTFPFYGKSISWYGIKGPDQGIAIVRLDGNVVGTVDLYSPFYESSRSLHSFSFSTPGYHQLHIILTAGHNPSSTGTTVNIDALDVVYN